MIVVACALEVSCPGPPEVGEYGRFRYVGRTIGEAPLPLLPPVADGSGTVYTLAGDIKLPQVTAFVSRVGGGEVGGCTFTKGDSFGAHGWVGFTQDKQFYWSGDALVEMNSFGNCRRVLDHDPGTDADLEFKAVLPWVRDTPSRQSLVVLVRSPVDAAPLSALVDLNANLLANVRPFEPKDASDVKIIGVGADRETNQGVVLLRYNVGDEVRHEARFYDKNADLTATASIRTEPLAEYGVRGYLELADGGLIVGLLDDARLVALDRSGGRIIEIDKDSIEPVGVHRWEGRLYLVGESDGQPVIAEIGDDGVPGTPSIWEASQLAESALRGSVTILDDRSRPARNTTWTDVTSAIGNHPFLSAHSPIQHAPGTTLWLVAGPSFDTGGARITSFAMAPVGIEYP